MIKDVFNSIATSSGSVKSSPLEQINGGKKENNEPGFFGKMLLALQKEGEGNTESGETESGSLENEEDSLRSFPINESKNEDGTTKLISNKHDQDVETELEDRKNLKEIEKQETQTTELEEIVAAESSDESDKERLDASAFVDRVKNDTTLAEESSVSLTQEEKASDLNKNIALNSDSRPAEEKEQSQSVDGNEKEVASNSSVNSGNTSVNTEGAESSNVRSLNDAVQGETNESAKNHGRLENITPAEKPSDQLRNIGLKEGEVQNQSIGISGSESKKNLQVEPEQVVNSQNSSADSTAIPNVKADTGMITEINKPIKETQSEPETEVKRRFIDLNRSVKAEPMTFRKPMADSSEKIQSQAQSTVRLDLQGEQVDRDFSTKINLKESPQLQAEVTNAQKINEERAKRYDLFSQKTDGRSISGDRLGPVSSGAGTGLNQQGMGFSAQPNWIQFQSNSEQQTNFTDIQETFFNEQILESAEATENGTSEQAKLSMNRLSEMPINNVILKRSVLPGLTGALKSATSPGKQITQSWQKHSFNLDDGNKIELSTRNVDGVIQVKIASTSSELIKLMQEYGQEIKDHLEQECELNFDLQFDNGENESAAGFSDNSPSSGNRDGNNLSSGKETNKILNKKAEEHLQQTVRKFGYNQMEWTI